MSKNIMFLDNVTNRITFKMRPRGNLTTDLDIKEMVRRFKRSWLASIITVIVIYFIICAYCFANANYTNLHNQTADKFNALNFEERQAIANWDDLTVDAGYHMAEVQSIYPKDVLRNFSRKFYACCILLLICYPSFTACSHYLRNKRSDIAISDLPWQNKTCRKVFLMCYAAWPFFLIDFIRRKHQLSSHKND